MRSAAAPSWFASCLLPVLSPVSLLLAERKLGNSWSYGFVFSFGSLFWVGSKRNPPGWVALMFTRTP